MRVVVEKLSMYDFDGDVDSIIKRLNVLKDQYYPYKLGIDSYMEQERYSESYYPVFEVFYNEQKKGSRL